MQYEKYRVNQQFSIIKTDTEQLYYFDSTKVKIIKGGNLARIPLILDRIRDCKDPYNKDFLAENNLVWQDIDSTVGFLVHCNFLIESKESQCGPDVAKVIGKNIGVVGGSMFFNNMDQFAELQNKNKTIGISFDFPADSDMHAEKNFIEQQSAQLKKMELSSILFFPENLSNRKISLLNRTFIDADVPFLLVMFNGKELLMGPSVLPMKTPCLDCLYEHRITNLPPNAGVNRDDFLKSVENFPVVSDSIHASAKRWLSWIISNEVLRLASDDVKPSLMKKQIRMPLHLSLEPLTTEFEPITTCPACSGMNLGNVSPGISVVPEIKMPELESSSVANIQYKENGLRRAKASEAQQLLENALNAIGVGVTLERITTREMDKIVPSYSSRVSTVYSRKLPFIVEGRFHWGKGMTEEQAYLSGGFELMERISAEYYGDVEMIRCPYKAVQDFAIDIRTRIGTVCYARNIDMFDEDMEIDWVWGYSYRRNMPVLVPASMVYHTRSVFKGKFLMNSSSGLAAGATLEDAILQGFMEAVEHDARYIVQANAVTMPQFDNSTFPEGVRDLIRRFEELQFDVIIRNYTLDNGIYVFRAWLVQKDNPLQYAGCGMGANLDPLVALKRAISEAKQSWPVFPRSTNKTYYAAKVNSEIYDGNSCSLFNLYHDNQVEILPHKPEIAFSSLQNLSSGNVIADIKKSYDMVQRCVENFDLIVVNLTRDIFKIPVVRVITSGLQNPHQPQQNFPGERVFTTLSQMGLADHKLNFLEIYNDRHLQ